MSTNGERRPPRPRIEIVTSAASPQEAAAVVSAVERFLVETAPPPVAAAENRWQRAALVEGVSAKEPAISPWSAGGNPNPALVSRPPGG